MPVALTLAAFLTLVCAVLSCLYGEVPLSAYDILTANLSPSHAHIFYELRLPRVLHGWLNGCALGLAGVAMQALFRNPLADPGVIGVSAGATVGAVSSIMLGITAWYILPLQAFIGGAATLWLLLRLSRYAGQLDTQHILLVGIAINAFAFALVGMAAVYADSQQLRLVWEWNLGGLRNAQWPAVLLMAGLSLVSGLALLRQRDALDKLLLGEQAAFFTGVNVVQLQRWIMLSSACLVAASVAFSGVIGFVGLIGPHIARRLVGASHRYVLPMSAACGGLLMLVADAAARLLLAPTELPVGVLTALLGAPFFLFILLARRAPT